MAKGTPKAVSAAAKKADALHKEIYGEAESDTTVLEAEAPVEVDGGEGGDIQPVEPQAQSDSSGDTSQPSSEGGAEVVDITPPSDTPPKEPEAAPQPASSEWEEKYKILQGKYNAEVPRMAGEIREMRKQMEQLLATPKPAVETPVEEKSEKNIVSDQDIVDYGEDLVDLIRRVAKAEAAGMTSSLTPKIEQIEGQFKETVQKQATKTIYSQLDADVQDWREINKSPDFLEWLATRDPYVGDYRKNLLSTAFEQGDSDRVAAFFKGFKAERQAVTPTQDTPPQTQTVPDAGRQPQVSLEQLAGPSGGPSSGVVNTQPAQTPNWTRAQVGQFYADVNAGLYAKDPDRKAQIEASIASAVKEGRIH